MSDNLDTVEGMMTESRYFYDRVNGRPTDFQMTAAQADMLRTLVQDAEGALVQRTADDNRLVTSRAVFRTAFDVLSKFFRALRQSIKDNPATTDVQRAELHLTTAGDGGGGSAFGALEFAPLVLVEQSGIHQHLIRFFMQGADSNSTRKPKGVLGAEIYQKIDGAATTALKDYALITLDTKSPYIYDFEAADAGKTAHYICLWTTADGDKSPQSEAFSLVIT